MTTFLPNDFIVRPATIDDVERAAELANLSSIDLTGRPSTNADELRIDWLLPSSDPETDIRLVLAPDQTLVGYAGVWDAAPHVRVYSWSHVHPEYRAQGIEGHLLDWIEARARQAIPKAPDGARVSVGQMRPSVDRDGGERMLARGYSVVRYFLEMQIEMDEPPPPPVFPPGIVPSSMADLPGSDEQRLRLVVIADRDIFRDHWGFVEQPFDKDFADWKHWVDQDPDHDSRLWFLAKQGDEIVGVSLCAPKSPQDPQMAWVISLGVKRPWRRQGIALALLHYSFGQFYQRGVRKVGLGVDGQSLTGATRLYEKAGMHPVYEEKSYEKELRPGVELATQSLPKAGSRD
jgi:ribosomal protein S18 acetylase RimI-like enzyme